MISWLNFAYRLCNIGSTTRNVNEKEIVFHVHGGVHETSATRAD